MKRPEWLTDELLQDLIEMNQIAAEYDVSGPYHLCTVVATLHGDAARRELQDCLRAAGISLAGAFESEVYRRNCSTVYWANASSNFTRRIAWCRAMIGSDRIILAEELPEFAILPHATE